MKLEQQHIDFENNCKKFIGIKISKVEYAEIAYHLHDNSEPKKWFATKFDNIHTVDFCVFLHTQTNDVIEIYWDDTFFNLVLVLNLTCLPTFPDIKSGMSLMMHYGQIILILKLKIFQ